MIEILFLIVILISTTALGIFILNILGEYELENSEKLLLSFGLGFCITGYLFYFLGLSANLNSMISYTFLTCTSFLAIFTFRKHKFNLSFSKIYFCHDFSKIDRFFILLLIIIFFILFLSLFSPYIGGDSVRAYLGISKLFATNQKIIHIVNDQPLIPNFRYTSYTHYPLLAHMVYTFCILIKGDLLAKIIHFTLVILIILSLYFLTQRWFDNSTRFYSVLAFSTMTGIINWAPEVRVDFPLTFITGLCVYALSRYHESKETKWLSLGAIFIGFACCIKINALVILPIMLAILVLEMKIGIKLTCYFFLIVILISLPFYIRSYILTGNPVWPYFNQYFPDAWMAKATQSYYIRNRNLYEYLLLPITFLLDVGKNSLLLTYLPVIFFLKENRYKNIRFLFYIFIFTVLVLVYSPGIRQSMALWPFICLLIGIVMSQLEKKTWFYTGINKAILMIAIIFIFFHAVIHSIEILPSAIGIEGKEHLLSRIYLIESKTMYHISIATKQFPSSDKIKYVLLKDRWNSREYNQYYNITTKDINYDLNDADYLYTDTEVNRSSLELIWGNSEYYIYKNKQECKPKQY